MSNTVPRLSRMTKAQLLERAQEFERLYNEARGEFQMVNAQRYKELGERDQLMKDLSAMKDRMLTYQYLYITGAQASKLRKDAATVAGHLRDTIERERDVLVKVKDSLRELAGPVRICPRCGHVEHHPDNKNVLCAECLKALSV